MKAAEHGAERVADTLRGKISGGGWATAHNVLSGIGGFAGDVVSGVFRGTHGVRAMSGGGPSPLANYVAAGKWAFNALGALGDVEMGVANLVSPLARTAADVPGLALTAMVDLVQGSNSYLGKLGAGVALAGYGVKLGGAATRSMEFSRDEGVGNPYLSPNARRTSPEQQRLEQSTAGLAFSLNRLGRRQGEGLTVRYGKRNQQALQMTGYHEPW
jgi:hypothetical protein